MARTKKAIKLDLSKPINVEQFSSNPDDCFGNEWHQTAKPCTRCSLYGLCMTVLLSKGNSKKAAQIKKPNKHFLDELDWQAVPWEQIKNEIKKTPGELTLNDLRATVKHLAKVIDDTTVHLKVNNWLINNNIKVTEGCLY